MILTPRFTSGELHPKDNHNITENLPELLKLACSQFSDPTERELFLFAALGVLSGCLPNYYGHYDGRWISPHLYVYVLAPYGTGKGSMIFAKSLGDAIQGTKRVRYKAAMTSYRQQVKAVHKKKKGNTDTSDTSAIPVPPNEMLYYPADSSKSALIDSMNDNRGSGIIFETEGDTLASALKQDYGAYSDILRKAFHHEYVSFLRRQDKEYKEILEPRLAVVISSTYDQYLKLIGSAENGLVSRFAYYLLPENKEFRDVFSEEKKNHKDYFKSLGESIEHKYDYLHTCREPVYFHLTSNQEEVFNSHFSKAKKEAEGLEGSINRLGIICFRLAMILGFCRHYDENYDENGPVKIMCNDRDFINALAITNILHENAETIHTLLPATGKGKMPGNKQALCNDLPEKFTTQEAIKMGNGYKIGKRTVERFLTDSGKFEWISQGNYRKVI